MPPHALGDHPVIRNMERTGFPDGKCEEWPVCPACGGETDLFYFDVDGDLVGCDNCVTTKDAWEHEKRCAYDNEY